MTRYRVRHATRYLYSSQVELAASLLHLRPLRSAWQSVGEERLWISPAPRRQVDRQDRYGNRVTWLFVDRPHTEFEVVSEALVCLRVGAVPPADATARWEQIRDLAAGPGASGHGAAWHGADAALAAEFRFESPRVPALAGAVAYAAPSFPPGRPLLAALLELTERIFGDFKFRAGVTSITTPIAQVLERREGVCQDFTHLMLSALRGLGLPARYTSGYIRTRPPPGQPRRQGADVSHAWVSAWLGPDHGWIGLDPTNGIVVGSEHVVLATGRDFSDVSPMRGMILGGGPHTLHVEVDLEALDGD